METWRSVAHRPFDPALRAAAQRALMYPDVKLTGEQALVVALGMGERARASGYHIHAFAILPGHIHLVIGRHRFFIERVTNQFKGAGTRALERSGFHPLRAYRRPDGTIPSPWSEGLWKVFLDIPPKTVLDAIDYVIRNPDREGKPRQHWSFITPYRP